MRRWSSLAGSTPNQYACLWLDSGAGPSSQSFGYAKPGFDQIAFLFNGRDGSTSYTTFAYEKDTGTWDMLIDAEDRGKIEPFARARLARK